jgi:hypothetical protein
MRKRLVVLFVFAALAVVGQSVSAAAQAIPRTADGKPDFTGVWAGPAFTHKVGPNDTESPAVIVYDVKQMAPLTPLGKEKMFRKATGDVAVENPTAVCLPAGLMLEIQSPYAQQWIQAPGYMVIRYEYQDNASRIIPIDGRPHSKDVELTWMGDSVGHWEGDTLVIDTIGVKEWALDDSIHMPAIGGSRWHSDALHVVERVRFTGPKTASYDVTIDDPKYFTKPWMLNSQMNLHPTWNLQEFVCAEDNRCANGKCTPSDAQKTSR